MTVVAGIETFGMLVVVDWIGRRTSFQRVGLDLSFRIGSRLYCRAL